MGYFVVIIAMLLGLFLFVGGAYILKGKPDDPSTDAGQMSLGMRRLILAYFLLLGGLLVALLIDLNMLDFPQTAVTIPVPTPVPTPIPTPTPTPSPAPKSQASPTPTPNPSPTPKQASAGSGAGSTGTTTPPQAAGQTAPAGTGTAGPTGEPVLTLVMPRITTGKAPATYLDVYGTNLTEGQIRINGQVRPTTTIGPNLLETLPDPSDIQGQGSLTVDVINKGKISNCLVVPIDIPTARLNLGWWEPYITREIQLLLIVIIAGALGCLIHTLNSITFFIANRSAIASWFWWYITRPLFGMALALIFYAVLRGGFLAGSPADVKAISPFGVLAIGALVGMFSQRAMGKLADIFETLFHSKTDEIAKDKAKKVSIKTATLPAGRSGQAYSAQLEALDASPALTWDVSGLPATLTFDPKTGIISGNITVAAGTSATVKVVANDGPGNSDTKTFTLNV